MKLFKTLIILISISLFANANTDKQNIEVLSNLYEKVVIKDVQTALEDIKNLKTSVKNVNVKKSKDDFSKFVKSWKSVQTFYLLGDLNEDFIDTPRYLDIFHHGNEDITKQLDRAIKSDDEIRITLFKNSLKSINALEYVIFQKDIKNNRVNEISLAILKKMESHILDIKNEYLKQKENFLSNLKKANGITINKVIQNSYKLKEWRIGDVIGVTKKYEGKPNNKRAEYFLSKNSANAIEAILITYKNILDNDSYNDYGDYLISITDGKEMKKLRNALNKSLQLIKKIKNDDFSNAKKLYDNINTIHVVLFVEMIEDLSINAKILDADGD